MQHCLLHGAAALLQFVDSKCHTRGVIQVLVEGDNPKVAGQAVGRSRHNKLVFFDGDGAALAGQLVTVFIDRVHAYTLFGRRTEAL